MNDLRRHKILLGVLFIAAILAFVLVVIVYRQQFGSSLDSEQAAWGQFGDYVGGILNPAFALLALFALFYTIILQVRELDETRKELQRTTLAAQLQTFENNFFHMLQLHNQIRDSWQVTVQKKNSATGSMEDHTHTGQKARFTIAQQWALQIGKKNSADEKQSKSLSQQSAHQYIEAEWKAFLKHEYGQLGHYFRNLYTIIKRVDMTQLPIDKKEFVNIVRSQLSAYEFYLLFYNCLLQRHSAFKKLIEEYEFFEHLNSDFENKHAFLPIPDSHYLLYDKSAYGKNVPDVFSAVNA